MNKWDKRFFDMAKLVASWSRDPSTQVGAVIVDDKNRIVSVGFNGAPRGVSDEQLADRDRKLRRTIHAEKNAILFANRSLEGCTIYITHPPCAQCAAVIIQSGIKEVMWPIASPEFLLRWELDYNEAVGMFIDAGVQFETCLEV